VCLFVCVFTNISHKRVLDGSEYEIGWDYDVNGIHHVSGIHNLNCGHLKLKMDSYKTLYSMV